MSNHPIEGLMNTAMENLKNMVDVNTIVGDPVHTPDGSVIITVSKVGFGFAAGGSEFSGHCGRKDVHHGHSNLPFGGGSGAGVSITPIAFLVVNNSGVKMLHMDERTSLIEKVVDAVPTAFDKVNEMVCKMRENQGNLENTTILDDEMENF